MFAVQILVKLGERHGISRARLLRGWPLAASVGEREVPVSWSAYVDLVERLRDTLGGDDALAEAASQIPAVTPLLSSFAALFITPIRLARFFARTLDPRIWPCMSVQFEALPGGLLHVVHSVPGDYRGATSVFAAAAGAWRTTPCRLGLPPAEMLAVAVEPRRGDFLMRMPAPKSVSASARAIAVEAFARFAADELATDAATIERASATRSSADPQRIGAIGAPDRAITLAQFRWALTRREAEVVKLVVRGLPNKDIAAELGCAAKTVEMHVTGVMKKSLAKTRTELIHLLWQLEGAGSASERL